ncbi:MAG: hypothetical protein UT32_C0032G0009 [Parcubacteria group bacterium GW2011_GWC2_39_14]|nr:MAG: hypothetical protein UT32_C0032G0009 [Parcubacteria group bacterium GW2011_GWC2_39_14]KKR53233.1 MAG: hypothetical protein UT91_C0031G0009 [Parcubacteria group bacterium GW2011_GWA2_40_23]
MRVINLFLGYTELYPKKQILSISLLFYIRLVSFRLDLVKTLWVVTGWAFDRWS